MLEKQRLEQAPRLHKHAGAAAYTPERLAKRSLIIAQQETLPKKHSFMEALTTTAKFGATAQGVIKRIDELIRRRKLDANRKTVVVMATNQGTLDLVANFACSCRAGPPEVQRALASTLVFTGDSETSKQVELFGLASFHDSALGDLPEGAAKAYGDYAFVRMMCVIGVLLRASGVEAVPSRRWRRGYRTRRRRDAIDAPPPQVAQDHVRLQCRRDGPPRALPGRGRRVAAGPDRELFYDC